MSFLYAGSQFTDERDRNIDPILLSNNGQYLHDDIEIEATGDAVYSQQANVYTTPQPIVPQTPRHHFNPEPNIVQPVTPQQNQSPNSPFQRVSARRPSNQRSAEWRRNIAIRNFWRQMQTPDTPTRIDHGWQENNPFAPLSPEWSNGAEPGHHQIQGPSTQTWAPHQAFHQYNSFPTPPSTGEYHGDRRAAILDDRPGYTSTFPSVYNNSPTGRGDGHTRLSSTNVSTLPTSPPHTGRWNMESYSPGDRTMRETLAPPSPTPRSRHGRRASTATSALTTELSCETCGKSFEKRHELEHHRRWHGERPYTCGVCNKAFVADKDRRRHVKTHNKAERHLFCNIIGCKYYHKGFQRKDHLKRHYETKHPGNLLSPPATSSIDFE